MKKAMLALVFLMSLVVVAYAQGPGETGGYGPGWYGMGPGMMGGYGPGGYEMGPGYGGYGMGPGRMYGWGGYGGGYGGYQGACPNCGYGRGYRCYGPRPGCAQSEECQKFLDDTVTLRKELYNKRFEYSEAMRNPKTSPKTVTKLRKEMGQIQEKISSEAPEGCGW